MKNNSSLRAANCLIRVLRSPIWLQLILIFPLLLATQFAMAESGKSDPDIISRDSAATKRDSDSSRNDSRSFKKFDHLKTGFNLTGAHDVAQCDNCHLESVFKGTPRDCSTCHSAGNRRGAARSKPANHIVTTTQCDSCHKTTVWTDATFSHVSLAPGDCLKCHDGKAATGKSSGHTPTIASCDNCHTTTSWRKAVFNHTVVANMACFTCHNGAYVTSSGTTLGKSKDHIPTRAMPVIRLSRIGSSKDLITHRSHQSLAAIAISACMPRP
jgi:hypothetical protein